MNNLRTGRIKEFLEQLHRANLGYVNPALCCSFLDYLSGPLIVSV